MRPRAGARVAIVIVALAVPVVLASGCGSAGVPAPTVPGTSPTAAGSAATVPTATVAQATAAHAVPASPVAPASAAASASPAAPASPASTSPGTSSPGPPSGPPSGTPEVDVVMDPGLLAILPEAIGTAKVEIEPDSFADAIGDASFAASVDSAAFAVVVEGDDLASGVVAHLRPGAYSDGFYRDWRDSYDEGACGQAGGVAGRAEVTLGGRPVYITTCTGGLRVYHVYVPQREVVVSLFSLGERRFGEQLVAGLRP